MTLAHDINQISRTRDVQISHNITFDTMLLTPETLQGLKGSGFHKPSPIQLHGIPLGKCGFDLLLEAKSGTGKTAVFTLIALEKIELSKGLQVVILAPTREIAAQICDVIKQIGSGYKGLAVEVVMGGLPVQEDIEKFKRNVHIVVASPGRLRHLIQDKHIDVSSVRLLVLDEADKLMEKSFQEDIKNIFSFLPPQKQVIMSSATYTETAKAFINNYVQNAQHVCPNSNCVLIGVDQKLTLVKCNSNIIKQTQIRFQEVLKIFTKIQFKQCLIFCNYQVRVPELHKLLSREKWPAEQLYGNQEQTDRLDALKTLQEYKCRILIATDLAARGIDASNIDLVINFEPPFEWQTYLHRIGRAGRYGSYGMAITILSEGVEAKKFHSMLDPMKNTINISNLWSNDENSNTDSNKVSEEIISTDNIENIIEPKENGKDTNKVFKELWNMLVSTEETLNTLENFESLCASFNKCNSHIEKFDELLQSFENYKHDNDTNTNFKHMSISNGPCKKFCISLNEHINMIEKLQCRNSPNESSSLKPETTNGSKLESETDNNDEESRKHNNITANVENGNLIKNDKIVELNDSKDFSSKSEFRARNVTEPNYNSHSTKKSIQHSEKTNGYSKNPNKILLTSIENGNEDNVDNNEDFDSADIFSQHNGCVRDCFERNDNYADTRKALLDAGLPTEFGKPQKNRKSRFHVNQSRQPKNYSTNKNTRSHPNNECEYVQGNSSNNESSSSTESSKSEQYSSESCNSCDNNKYRKQKNSYPKYSKTRKTTSWADDNLEDYVSWFRNLKFQTKQIEMAVYIDELSKL